MDAVAFRCTLGEILYALDKIWVRHMPSSPVVLDLYIASFCGGREGGSNKEGGKKRYNDDDNNDNHDEEEEKEDKEER